MSGRGHGHGQTDMGKPDKDIDHDMELGHGDNDVDWSKLPGHSVAGTCGPWAFGPLNMLACAFDRLDICDDFTLHNLATPIPHFQIHF